MTSTGPPTRPSSSSATFNAGTPEQQQHWLPGLASGDAIGTLALLDAGDEWSPEGVALEAARDGDAIVLDGRKRLGKAYRAVARALEDQVPAFAVATVEEAVDLREAGIRTDLLVLEGATTRAATERAGAHGLVLMVHAESQVDMLPGSGASAWVKVDTGMHRVGAPPVEAFEIARQIDADDRLSLQGVLTHFAVADEPSVARP